MRRLLLFLSAVWCCALVSCIEGDEEVFLHADGSGSVSVVYRIPGMLLSEKDGEKLQESIRQGVADYGGLELVRNTVVRDQSHQVISVEVKSDNVIALSAKSQMAFLEKPPTPMMAGVIASIGLNMTARATGVDGEISGESSEGETSDKFLMAMVGDIDVKMRGRTVEFRRDIDLASMLGDGLGGSGLAMLGDSEFRYTLHLPNAAKSSNAHETLEGGKTLKWAYRLAASKETPIMMRVTAPVPLPWWIYAPVVIIAVLMLLIIVLMVRRKKQV